MLRGGSNQQVDGPDGLSPPRTFPSQPSGVDGDGLRDIQQFKFRDVLQSLGESPTALTEGPDKKFGEGRDGETLASLGQFLGLGQGPPRPLRLVDAERGV